MANGGTPDALAAAVRHATEMVDECLTTAISSFEAATGDAYDADRWAKDMARLWACGVRGWARAATDLSALAAELAGDTAGEGASGGGGSSAGTTADAAGGGQDTGATV